jgi:hypothetical protein
MIHVEMLFMKQTSYIDGIDLDVFTYAIKWINHYNLDQSLKDSKSYILKSILLII